MLIRLLLSIACLSYYNISLSLTKADYNKNLESIEKIVDICFENNNLSCVHEYSDKMFEYAKANNYYIDALTALNWKIYYVFQLEDYKNYSATIQKSLDYLNYLLASGKNDSIIHISKFYNKYLLFYYYSKIGQFEKSLDSLTVLFKDITEKEAYAFSNYRSTFLQNLTDLSYKSGKRNLAINYANELISLNKSINLSAAGVQLLLASIYLKSYELDNAQFHIDECIKDISLHKDVIKTYPQLLHNLKKNLIELLYKQKQYTKALVEANKAVEELYKYKQLNLSPIFMWIAKIQLTLGNQKEAIKYLQKIEADIQKNSGFYPYLSKAEFSLLKGDIFRSMNNQNGAYFNYIKTLDILKEGKTIGSLDTNNTVYLSNYIPAIEGILLSLDQFKKRKDYPQYIQKILHVLDNFRSFYSDESDKYNLTKSLYKAIETSLDFLSEPDIHDTQLAFQLMERAKALNLFESYNTANLQWENLKNPLIQKEVKLQKELNTLSQSIQNQSGDTKSEDFFTSQISSRYIRVSKELDSVKTLIKIKNPDYYALKFKPTLTNLSDIQRILTKGKVLLLYITGEQHSYILIISKDTVRLHKISLSTNDLTTLCNKYLQHLLSPLGASMTDYKQNLTSFSNLSHQLYSVLLKGFIPKNTDVSHLLISADGVLNDLPFETLLTSKPENPTSFQKLPYLINDYAVSYIFSGSLYKMMKENSDKKPGKILAFAPDFKMDFYATGYMAPILNNREEINFISSLAKTKTFEGKSANKANFIKHVNSYPILHLATHGFSDNTQSNNSYISFSQYGSQINPEEKLYVKDLYNYRINADMVVLSACETNLGQYFRGEGVYSLARSFAYAGCNSIVTSLWKVNQKSTAELMKSYYVHIKKGLDKSEALRQAKLELMQKGSVESHPYYWAGFVVLGNEDEIKLDKNWKEYWVWFVFTLVIITGVTLGYKKIRRAA